MSVQPIHSQAWEGCPSTSSSSAPNQHVLDVFLIEPGNVLQVAPRSKWLDQIRSDNNLPLADLWGCAIRWVSFWDLGWRNGNSDDNDEEGSIMWNPLVAVACRLLGQI